MNRLIPLHALVVVIAGDEGAIKKCFPPSEVLSVQSVMRDLIGDRASERPDLIGYAQTELYRRIEQKLFLGERVVVVGDFLRRESRDAITKIGSEIGVPIFYLLTEISAQCRDITYGDDGVAEVIDVSNGDWPSLVVSPDPEDLVSSLAGRFKGITVIGDVHGSIQSLYAALRWARARQHFVVFTGDIVSHGPATLEVADEVHRVVCHGEALFIMGNHERKIMRWLERNGRDVRLNDGNRVTTSALNGLSAPMRKRWIGRFRGLVNRSELIARAGRVVIAHAAIHPDFWTGVTPRWSSAVRDAALFGEFEQSGARFSHTYKWVDHIPNGWTAIVGHDIRSRLKPVVVDGEAGGRAIFLDTGCGKGGRLSSADLRFTEDSVGIKLENFNMH